MPGPGKTTLNAPDALTQIHMIKHTRALTDRSCMSSAICEPRAGHHGEGSTVDRDHDRKRASDLVLDSLASFAPLD